MQIDTVRHFTYSHCKDSDQSANSSLEAGVVCVVEGFPFDIGVKERYWGAGSNVVNVPEGSSVIQPTNNGWLGTDCSRGLTIGGVVGEEISLGWSHKQAQKAGFGVIVDYW